MRRCEADTCDNPTRSNSSPWCEKHYYRLRRNGALTARPHHWRTTCSVDGCEEKEQGRQLCARHLARLLRRGDPLAPFIHQAERDLPCGDRNVAWTGDAATYNGVHQRLRRRRGSADQHPCAACGQRAKQWSYDHTDADERIDPRYGPYSVDLGRYKPLCVPCHKRFDLTYIADVKSGAIA